jgi:hypothetical protein
MPSIYQYINRFRDTVDNAWRDTDDNFWRKLIRIVSFYGRGTRKRNTSADKNVPSADFGRKPYLYDIKRESPKSDYHDMMREVPQRAMMDQKLAKDSEFDKPYLHEDYQEMEYLWPWPGLTHPPFEMPKSKIPTGDKWQGGGCIITCSDPHECNQPIKCSPAIFEYWGPTAGRYSELKFDIKVNGQAHTDFKIEGNSVYPLWINPPYRDDALGDDYAYRWQSAEKDDLDILEVTMTDGAGNVCSDTIVVLLIHLN